MTLLNQHWQSFSGEPITGRTPTQTRVMNDVPMNALQAAGVAHAYKLFTDAVLVTPSKFLTRDRVLQDGTRIRLVSNQNIDVVMVWPVGGGGKTSRFFGGIAVQLETVVFNPNGNSYDSSTPIWKGDEKVISGVSDLPLLLPANGDGTKNNKTPEDLIIWVDPTATLGPDSLSKGKVKIRRAKVLRGPYIDLNFGSNEDGTKVTPRNLMSMEYQGIVRAFYLCGKELPFKPPTNVGGLNGKFVFSEGFDAPFNWKAADLNGLVVIGLYCPGTGEDGLLSVCATLVKKGVAAPWVTLSSNGAIGLERYYTLVRKALPGQTPKIEYTVRTTAGSRTGDSDYNGEQDTRSYDTTAVVTTPKRLTNLADVTSAASSAVVPYDQVEAVTQTNSITQTVTSGIFGEATPYKNVNVSVARSAIRTKGGVAVAAAFSDFSCVTTNVIEIASMYDWSFANNDPSLSYDQIRWDRSTADIPGFVDPPPKEGFQRKRVALRQREIASNGTTTIHADLYAFYINAVQTSSLTTTGEGFTRTESGSGPFPTYGPVVPVVSDYSKDIKINTVLRDAHTGGASVTLALEYLRRLVEGPANNKVAGRASFGPPALKIDFQRLTTLPKTALQGNLLTTFVPPGIWQNGRESTVTITGLQAPVDPGRGYANGLEAVPFPIAVDYFPSAFRIDLIGGVSQLVWDATVSFSHTANSTGQLVNTASFLSNYGVEVDPAFMCINGVNGQKHAQFFVTGLPAPGTSPLTLSNNWPTPNYNGPKAAAFAYDARTRSFFFSLAVSIIADDPVANHTQRTLMLIGNTQGSTDFYPLLNEWLAKEHLAVNDDKTEIYGPLIGDKKIIVGLNMAQPTLV